MRHEEYKELLALSAAGAVDPSEARALDAHLASCAECRDELSELRDAAASLAYTVAPVEPPPALRASLLTQIKTLKSASADGAAAAVEEEEQRPSAAWTEEAPRVVGRLSLWELFRARPALGFGAAAAGLAIAALATLSVALWGRTHELSAEVARLAERLEASEGELARERGQMARVQEVNEFLTAPGARVMSLAGTKTAPRASARVAYDQSTGRVLLLAYDLPPAPAGKAYQLWFIAGDRRILPGGVFKPDGGGRGSLSDRLPPDARSTNAFAVTLEDERGVQTAQGEMYLLGSDS